VTAPGQPDQAGTPDGVRILELREPAGLEAEERAEALETLEGGGIVFFPAFGFELSERERELIAELGRHSSPRDRRSGRPTLLYDPERRRTRGSRSIPAEVESVLERFSNWSAELLHELLPPYRGALLADRVTFRPVPRESVQGLHVDASYLKPHHGRGMLRVFHNADPSGTPRVWRIGEQPFEEFAKHYLPTARTTVPPHVRLADTLFSSVGLADRRATPSDHLMADIRGQGKRDKEFQKGTPQRQLSFPSGSTWVAFTDLLLHGAVSGQHSLDRSFFLPADAMQAPDRSSLRILERLTGLEL